MTLPVKLPFGEASGQVLKIPVSTNNKLIKTFKERLPRRDTH